MTVTGTIVSIAYAGDGSSRAFTVPFIFFGPDEIAVFSRIGASGTPTSLTRGVHYNVTGGNDATGLITATVAPAVGTTWIIRRRTARTQQVDYIDFDPFPADTTEQALDRLTAQSQENDESLGRTIRAPIGDAALNALTAAAVRANLFLAFDGNGQPVALAPAFTGPVSSAMVPVVGSATTMAALSALNFAEPSTGGGLRSIAAKLEDDSLSLMDFTGADNSGTNPNDAAFQAWVTAVLTSGRPGWIPAGRYRMASPATLDWATAKTTGALFRGAGVQRAILDFSTAGGGLTMICSGTGAVQRSAFYGQFVDIGITGNYAGALLTLGTSPGNIDFFNEMTFRTTVRNLSTSALACGIESNGLFNCDLFIVANCAGHGDAFRSNQTQFCRIFGSFGSADNGQHLTGSYTFGNAFVANDIEVVTTCVQIDTIGVVQNTWTGGQFNWNPALGGHMVNATAGNNNRFIGGNPSSAGATAVNTTGIVIYGTSGAGTEYLPSLEILSSADASMAINGAASHTASLYLTRAGSLRWLIQRDNATESGGNAGSELIIGAYADDGTTSLGNPLYITRPGLVVHLANASVGDGTGAGGKVGFFGATPGNKPTVTGAKGGNAALTSLLSTLSTMGLLTDSTT